MSYATDGRCHNSEPSDYGHECGKTAKWLGTKQNGYQSGFCDYCKRYGFEAREFVEWQQIEPQKKESS